MQLILDAKSYPGSLKGLEFFKDAGRAIYGLQNRLGVVAGHQAPELHFLGIPVLDIR